MRRYETSLMISSQGIVTIDEPVVDVGTDGGKSMASMSLLPLLPPPPPLPAGVIRWSEVGAETRATGSKELARLLAWGGTATKCAAAGRRVPTEAQIAEGGIRARLSIRLPGMGGAIVHDQRQVLMQTEGLPSASAQYILELQDMLIEVVKIQPDVAHDDTCWGGEAMMEGDEETFSEDETVGLLSMDHISEEGEDESERGTATARGHMGLAKKEIGWRVEQGADSLSSDDEQDLADQQDNQQWQQGNGTAEAAAAYQELLSECSDEDEIPLGQRLEEFDVKQSLPLFDNNEPF